MAAGQPRARGSGAKGPPLTIPSSGCSDLSWSGVNTVVAIVALPRSRGPRFLRRSFVFGEFAALFSKFQPGKPWSLPLDAIDQVLASSLELGPRSPAAAPI